MLPTGTIARHVKTVTRASIKYPVRLRVQASWLRTGTRSKATVSKDHSDQPGSAAHIQHLSRGLQQAATSKEKDDGPPATTEVHNPSFVTSEHVKKVRRRKIKSTAESEQSSAARKLLPLGSDKHHDLQSFLAHSKNANLDQSTAVWVGTHYEYTVMEVLKPLGFALERTGGASDLGIDILGHWIPPADTIESRVLLQCKVSSERSKPSWIRELEGAYAGAPLGWNGEQTLAFLVASREATKGVLDAMTRSRLPLGFLNIDREGSVRQFVWNQVAANNGLEGVGVALRHGTKDVTDKASKVVQEIVLTWKGRPWPKRLV